MMSLWDALRMNMMISYQELVRTFLNNTHTEGTKNTTDYVAHKYEAKYVTIINELNRLGKLLACRRLLRIIRSMKTFTAQMREQKLSTPFFSVACGILRGLHIE
ncbi:hypothetical protein CRX66_13955 [Klebsiella pneumoniae]|nr:hypothetical protein CRX65_26730 [Klebsiella pneumoniae]POB43473.1 hypothetical protein CRX66_13955 [Klebsiella pneumoniae]POB54905.1 hypothetical protein CRX62_22695 [Klebsiella pneumoniae]POB58312.1 hypothetical protein CRX63_16175 [Klebsiella pneumoniae]HBY5683591.1 hypothetical protein [Klebsiella pneumoniae]